MPNRKFKFRLGMWVFTSILVSALLTGSLAFAEIATLEESRTVAQNWIHYMEMAESELGTPLSLASDPIQEIQNGEITVGYCISLAPEGYIIVPALKEMNPVKFYSDAGSFHADDEDGFAAMIREVLTRMTDTYTVKYGSMAAPQAKFGAKMFDPAQRDKWNDLLLPAHEFQALMSVKTGEKYSSVGPLVTSVWEQGAPYNQECPVGDGGRTLVGCVATAAAQIMYYHQWPETGNGSYSYNWSGDDSCEGQTAGRTLTVNLSDPYDWANIHDTCSTSDPQVEMDAMSELNYETAVVYNMMFGVCASGAYMSRVPTAFTSYFKYDSGIDLERRISHNTDSWFEVIRDEVDEGRPMMYGIVGHAIVCDGWRFSNNTAQYHMNYGWGGNHSGWYAIDNLYDSENLSSETLYRYINPNRDGWLIPETGPLADTATNTGMTWFDFDGDHLQDVVLASAGSLTMLKNEGNGSFTDVSGVLPGGILFACGMAPGDFDNDGDTDLYVVCDGLPNMLLRNDNGIFEDATSGVLANDGPGESALWCDFDLDGDLDIMGSNDNGTNYLLRNEGFAVFVDVTPAEISNAANTQSASLCDYDNDGDMDLYLANWGSANTLLRNDGGCNFTDVTDAVVGDSSDTRTAVWGDYDNDGDQDLYIGNHGANKLIRNDSGSFVDVTDGFLGQNGDAGSVLWLDHDNDGYLDIFICNENSTNYLLNNGAGSIFTSVNDPGIYGSTTATMATAVDYDGNGALDIYLAGPGTNQILQNKIFIHHSATVALSGAISNTSAIGAKIKIVNEDFTTYHWVGANQGCQAFAPEQIHVGMHWTTVVEELEITWPTGEVQVFNDIEIGDIIEVSESPFIDATVGVLANNGAGRGVAWTDFDYDGDQDIYLVNHDGANALLINDGEGNFTDSGIADLGHAGAGNAAVWADFDYDGDRDVFLTNENEPNVLLRNNSDGTFSTTTVIGVDNADNGTGACWADFNLDGKLDIYVTNDGTANQLLKNFGDIGYGNWLFMVESGLVSDIGTGQSGTWGDYNGDNLPDLFIANSLEADVLLSNLGNIGFDNAIGIDMAPNYGNSRGAAWGDFDNDGDLDLYKANYNNPDKLFENIDGYLQDIHGGALDNAGRATGVAWVDYDNDGDLDIYLARHLESDCLLRNDGEDGFSHALTFLGSSGPESRTMAWADYDGDGDMDLYISMDGENRLLTNMTPTTNHWLHLDLVAYEPNLDAVGARVRIVTGEKTQTRYVECGSGYMTQNSLTVEFGMGTASQAETLEIRWPDGEIQTLNNVAGDRLMQVVQGEVSPVVEMPETPTDFRLAQAYPNPFNPSTRIAFDLPVTSTVNLKIYSLSGALVKTLVSDVMVAGRHSVIWNGMNQQGQPVASGTYFYRINADGFNSTRRMMLVK